MHRVNLFSVCKWMGIVVLCAAGAWAQDVNSSPNVVGSGARALGMGGAFIAVADDATAASWNPGGLTQLERPEVSVVYSWQYEREDFSDGFRFSQNGTDNINFDNLNYFSVAWPFKHTLGGRNLVFSLNYQRKYDFDRNLNFHVRTLTPISFGTTGFLFQSMTGVHYIQRGSLGALSPAFACEITDQLSVGMTVNLWDQSLIPSNEWYERYKATSGSRFGGLVRSWRKEEYEDFQATNYTFGILWKPTAHLSIGAVYNTRFAAHVKYTRTDDLFRTSHEKRRIEFPGSWGVGIAYRFPNDKLTLSMDVTRRDWDDFVEIGTQRTQFPFGAWPVNGLFPKTRISPITGLEKWRSHIDPTYTVRVGAEYVFINTRKPLQNYLPSLRVGAFYDPAPAGGSSLLGTYNNQTYFSKGSGNPDDYWGVTFGLGLLIKNRVNIDFAYEYRWGNDVRHDTFQFSDVDADTQQHKFYLSTVIYF